MNKPSHIPHFELKHRVKLAREYAGFQQSDLAKATGLARSTIAYIEAGEGRPRKASIALIAFATGVERHWLETGEIPKIESQISSFRSTYSPIVTIL